MTDAVQVQLALPYVASKQPTGMVASHKSTALGRDCGNRTLPTCLDPCEVGELGVDGHAQDLREDASTAIGVEVSSLGLAGISGLAGINDLTT